MKRKAPSGGTVHDRGQCLPYVGRRRIRKSGASQPDPPPNHRMDHATLRHPPALTSHPPWRPGAGPRGHHSDRAAHGSATNTPQNADSHTPTTRRPTHPPPPGRGTALRTSGRRSKVHNRAPCGRTAFPVPSGHRRPAPARHTKSGHVTTSRSPRPRRAAPQRCAGTVAAPLPLRVLGDSAALIPRISRERTFQRPNG